MPQTRHRRLPPLRSFAFPAFLGLSFAALLAAADWVELLLGGR